MGTPFDSHNRICDCTKTEPPFRAVLFLAMDMVRKSWNQIEKYIFECFELLKNQSPVYQGTSKWHTELVKLVNRITSENEEFLEKKLALGFLCS